MRKLTLIGSILLALGAFFAGGIPVFGDTGTVNVTVTAQAQSCILLDTTLINYGTLPFGGNNSSLIQFDSCTPATQSILARGTDATGTSWTLSDTGTCATTLGTNKFKHELQRLDNGNLFLSTADQGIGSLSGNALNQQLSTLFIMPCAGSSGAGLTASTTIVLTSTIP